MLDLTKLEAAINEFLPEEKVEVEVTLKIHDDVPAGYVEDDVASEGTYYKKIVDARGGTVTKSIRIFIPD